MIGELVDPFSHDGDVRMLLDRSCDLGRDPFTNAQEYPDTFAVGRATARGNRASVPVSPVASPTTSTRSPATIDCLRSSRARAAVTIASSPSPSRTASV